MICASFLNKAAAKYNRWSRQEDTFLRTLLTLANLRDWSQVTFLMEMQFPYETWRKEDCKNRWEEITSIPDSKQPWSVQEELEVIIVHKLCGHNWSAAAEFFEGRSNNSIKNRFYAVARRVVARVRKMEVRHSNGVELLKTMYVLSIMERLASRSLLYVVRRGNKEKEFIHTLMGDIDIPTIKNFKAKLSEYCGKELSLVEVWEEVAGPLERSKFQLTKDIRRMIDICNFVLSLQALILFNNQRYQVALPAIDFLTHSRGISKDEREFVISQAFASGQKVSLLDIEKSNEGSHSQSTKPGKTRVANSTLIPLTKRRLNETPERPPIKVKVLEAYQELPEEEAETKEEKLVVADRKDYAQSIEK